MAITPGDTVRMKKSHPCGGDTWQVVRTGADIGIRCLTCNRYVLIPRSLFERRVKSLLSHTEGGER
jgi:hypothetical protein